MTAMRWCGEEVSTAANAAVENLPTEQATGVSEKTCRGWCQEEGQFSGASNDAPENPVKVQGADKKEYPSERLSPEGLADRRRLWDSWVPGPPWSKTPVS